MRGLFLRTSGVMILLGAALAAVHGCGGDETPVGGPPLEPAPRPATEDGDTADAGTAGDTSTSDGAGTETGADAGPSFHNPRLGVSSATGAGTVNALLHVGTSWYIGGTFNRVSPYAASNLVALDTAAGATRATPTGCPLKSGFNGDVSAIATTPAAIFVGGSFTTYQGAPANRIAKIDAATCALDTTFSPAAANGFNDAVGALVVSATDVYVGGAFTTYRGVANSASRIAKLSIATGTLDTAFSPAGANANGFNDAVNALATNGTDLYVGGAFITYRGPGAGSAQRIAKLNPTTGALDTTFSPAASNGFNNDVNALALDATHVYVGGAFTSYRGTNNSARGIAKLALANGAIDAAFSPPGANANGFDGVVNALALGPTDVYAGGTFNAYRGSANSAVRLAKLSLAGAIDATFSPIGANANGFDGAVHALALSGGSLYAGGDFNAYRGLPGSAIRFAKLDAVNGALDAGFVPAGSNLGGVAGAATTTVASAVFSGTTLWVGGRFSVYAGSSASNLAKVDDVRFAVDPAFTPRVDDVVRSLAASGSYIYAGGEFTSYKGVASSALRIAKLDASTGALDATFSPVGATANGFDGPVLALAANATHVYAGGDFRAYRGAASNANRIAKLDASTGALDATFSPAGATANGFNNVVRALALGATDVYAGGDFTAYRGAAASANRIAKLALATGGIDPVFGPAGATSNGLNDTVFALALTATDLYAGGDFTAYRGAANSANRIVKIGLATGGLDPVFNPPGLVANGFTDGNGVLALAVTPTSVYAGGAFTAYKGAANSASRIARIALASGALDTTFSPGGGAPNGYDGAVLALAAGTSTCGSGCGTVVLVGGPYTQYRGDVARGLTVLDPATGAVR